MFKDFSINYRIPEDEHDDLMHIANRIDIKGVVGLTKNQLCHLILRDGIKRLKKDVGKQ